MGETYTVSFDGDGAPGDMQSVEGISGNYVLPESGFTYQSAILDYWALDNPDGEKAGCPGDIFPVTENVVFYASWRLVIVIPEPENPVVCIHAWGEWQSDADKHWRKCSKCDASDIRGRSLRRNGHMQRSGGVFCLRRSLWGTESRSSHGRHRGARQS